MRDAPPTVITGPILVFEIAGRHGESFVCSRCRTDFHTSDPVRAFEFFAARQHKCVPRSKAGPQVGSGPCLLTSNSSFASHELQWAVLWSTKYSHRK